MLKRIQQHMNAIEIARLTLSLSTRARACDTGADALLVGAMQPLFRLRSRAADDGRHERAAKKWYPHANAAAAQAYDHKGSRQDCQVRVITRMRSCAITHSHAAGTHAMRADCPVNAAARSTCKSAHSPRHARCEFVVPLHNHTQGEA